MLGGGQLLVAGAAAGLANSVVSGPVEHIRISKSSEWLWNVINCSIRTADATPPCQAIQRSLGRGQKDLSIKWHCRDLQRSKSDLVARSDGVRRVLLGIRKARPTGNPGTRLPARRHCTGQGDLVRCSRGLRGGSRFQSVRWLLTKNTALGRYLPDRHDQVPDSDRRI